MVLAAASGQQDLEIAAQMKSIVIPRLGANASPPKESVVCGKLRRAAPHAALRSGQAKGVIDATSKANLKE